MPSLTEDVLLGSEWKIAVQWDDAQEPQVTWLRCKENFELEWGTDAKGSWSFDGNIITFTRDFFLGWGGKRIFSAVVRRRENDVYLEGLVRGWSPIRAADFFGQWQAIRLGVDRTPYGEPSWLGRSDEQEAFPDVPVDDTSEEDEPFWAGAADSIKYVIDSAGDDAAAEDAPQPDATAQALEQAQED